MARDFRALAANTCARAVDAGDIAAGDLDLAFSSLFAAAVAADEELRVCRESGRPSACPGCAARPAAVLPARRAVPAAGWRREAAVHPRRGRHRHARPVEPAAQHLRPAAVRERASWWKARSTTRGRRRCSLRGEGRHFSHGADPARLREQLRDPGFPAADGRREGTARSDRRRPGPGSRAGARRLPRRRPRDRPVLPLPLRRFERPLRVPRGRAGPDPGFRRPALPRRRRHAPRRRRPAALGPHDRRGGGARARHRRPRLPRGRAGAERPRLPARPGRQAHRHPGPRRHGVDPQRPAAAAGRWRCGARPSCSCRWPVASEGTRRLAVEQDGEVARLVLDAPPRNEMDHGFFARLRRADRDAQGAAGARARRPRRRPPLLLRRRRRAP